MIKELSYADRNEWLHIRSQYIGGSDASAVIGLNPYKSAYTLWAEKTGKIPEFEGNLTTKVGSYLEDLVAKLFEEETGKKVRRKNRILVNDQYPWACANVDRLVVGEKALLEIKTTTSIPIMRKLRGSEEFPEVYYAQVVHYLAVTGYEKAYLAVLINCREFKVYELSRDQGEIDALMNAEQAFWSNVLTKKAPPIDGSDSSAETLSLLYPNSNAESSVDLTPFNTDLDTYQSLGKQIKELTAMQGEIGNRVKEYLGTAARGESDRFKVSFSTATRSSFDSKKFAKEHKDLSLDNYYKTSTYRTFKVTEVSA